MIILLLLLLSLLLSPAAPVATPSSSGSGTPSRRPSTSPSRPVTRTGTPSRRPSISVSLPNTRSASRRPTVSVSLPNTRSASRAPTVSVTLAPTRTSRASGSGSGATTVSGSLPVTRSQAGSPSGTGSPPATGRPTVAPSQPGTASPAPSPSACASASRSPSASNSVPSARGTPSGCASASACASASSSPSVTRSAARSQGASGSASASPSACASASASPCASASSSQSVSASGAPTPSAQGSASRCPSASATATPSASGSPSTSASASSAATPSATSSAPPCSCKANARASSSAGGACPTPLLSVSWPLGWRDDAQLLPDASAAEAPLPASALVASWPAIRSAVNITLPFPPSDQEQVTLTCALAGAGAGSLGLFTSAPGASCAEDARSCSAVLSSAAALSACFWLYASAPSPPAPLAATLLCTATSALRGGASDRPCASAAAAPVYPRLTQLTPMPLPARNLPSEWVLVGAVLAEEGAGSSAGGAARGVFTVQGGAPAAAGSGGSGGSVALSLPAACASAAASEAAAGGFIGDAPAPAAPALSLTNLSVSGSANPSACAAALQAPLAQLRAQALGAPTPTFSFTTGVASHLLLVAPPLADFPAGGVGAALGALGQAGLQCRGPDDAPCDAASPTCCRVNWATPTVLSLSTPPYGEGAQSLCGGAAWCQVPLSLFALPPGAAGANASSGSPFFNSSSVSSASAGRSPLAQQLWAAASSATAPTALYPPTVYPPTPLTLARSATSWPLVCAAQPPPQTPAALFACLNASGLSLDLAPPAPPLQRLAASAFPACTGLCLSQQCSGFAPLQSCGLVTAAARPCAPPPAPPCYQQLALAPPPAAGAGAGAASTPASQPFSPPCAYGSGPRCAACAPSAAAVCPGGNALYVQPGHWAPPPDASGHYDLAALVPCGAPLPASRCTGARPGAPPGCAPGYVGYACSACASGYFTASSDPGAPPGSTCARCPSMATYLDLALSFSGFVGQLGGAALALFAGAAGALRVCGEAPHRAVPLRALLRFLALRVLALLLWVVVFSQQASLLFSSVQALSVDALRSVFELLAVLQFRGLRSPNSQCLSVPFPFVWASATAVGLCYATVAVALGVWQCRRSFASSAPGVLSSSFSSSVGGTASPAGCTPDAPSPGKAVSAAQTAPAPACCALLRAATAALPRAAALLLTLAYGTLTSVFAAVVTCTPPSPMLYSAYLGIGGDGSSLPAGALPPPGAPPPNATLTVPVSLLASNPYQVCWEGAHTPAAAVGLTFLLAYSLAFPLGTLLLLRARGQGCYASFCAPLPPAPPGAADGEPSGCYACRRCRRHGRQQLTAGPCAPAAGVQYILEDEEGGLALAAALPEASSAREWLRALLRMPELRDGFLSLHQLALAAIALLLALPLAAPSAALGADVTLVLLTAAASVAIKQRFKPFQRSGSKWTNSTLSAFYAVTAFTALMLAVSRNTPRLSTASSWALSLLAILSGVLALCFVLYKWGVALCRSGRMVGGGGGGALGGMAGAAPAVMTPNPLLILPLGKGRRGAGGGGDGKSAEEEEEEEAAAWEKWGARAAAEEAAAAAALAAAAAAREAEAGGGSAQPPASGAPDAEGGEGGSGAGLQVQVDGEGSALGAAGAGGGGGSAGGAGEPPKEEGAVSPYLERMVQRIGSELERKSAQRERRRAEKEARDAAAAAAAAAACRDGIEQS